MDQLRSIRKYFSRIGAYFLIATLIIFAVQTVISFAINRFCPEWKQNPDISLLISVLSMYLTGIPVLILLLKKIPSDPPQKHSIRPHQVVVSALMCYGIMYFCNLAGSILTVIIGLVRGTQVANPVVNLTNTSNPFPVFLYILIAAPVMEEYIFRKQLIDRTRQFGEGTAILLSGFMFGFFHGNLNQFIYAFGIGTFLAFLYVKTGSIKVTILLHMIINFTGGVLGIFVLQSLDPSDFRSLLKLGAYAVFMVSLATCGLVLTVLYRKRMRVPFRPMNIPLFSWLKNTIFAPGILCFFAFWTVVILVQLLR